MDATTARAARGSMLTRLLYGPSGVRAGATRSGLHLVFTDRGDVCCSPCWRSARSRACSCPPLPPAAATQSALSTRACADRGEPRKKVATSDRPGGHQEIGSATEKCERPGHRDPGDRSGATQEYGQDPIRDCGARCAIPRDSGSLSASAGGGAAVVPRGIPRGAGAAAELRRPLAPQGKREARHVPDCGQDLHEHRRCEAHGRCAERAR